MSQQPVTPSLDPTLPDDLTVGGITFTVEPWSETIPNNDKDWGEVSYRECTVRIDHTLDRRQQLATLFHEIVHVLFNRSGLRQILDDKMQEAICECIGYGLEEMEHTGQLKLVKRKESK